MSDHPLLELRNVKKYFEQRGTIMDSLLGRQAATVKAVDDVSFTVERNESIGIIGESGCGKTTLIKAIIGLHDLTDGELVFKGTPISEFTKRDWKRFRRNVQMVFQDPFNSLDPKLRVRETLLEPLRVHDIDDKDERIRETLDLVELRPAEEYLYQYPKQLSGGEKQRVSIARALVLRPDVILADEPVSMLDVSTQSAVLSTFSELMDKLDVSMIYISHDISTVSYVCGEINVMYLGRIIEQSETKKIINDPKHPYTKALMSAVPIPDPSHDRERTELEESTPDPVDLEDGCRFKERCPERMDICDVMPQSIEYDGDHEVACHLYYDHETGRVEQ